MLRRSSTHAASLLRRQLLLTVEIPSSDRSYDYFLHFLAEHNRAQGSTILRNVQNTHPPLWTASGILARVRPRPRKLALETCTAESSTGASVTDFVLVPGQGKHIINYKSTLLQVERQRDTRRINLSTGTPFETVEITTLYSHRSVLQELLCESQQTALREAEEKTIIYTSWGTEWKPFGNPRRKRSLDSVILAPLLKENLLKDVRGFLGSADWYRDRGIPYRRGYLLHGPPGTGKSSFVQALAGELDYHICMVNLSERGLTDDRLMHLLTMLPERSIALLEDVDAAFTNRRQVDQDGYRGANVTYSGLLNALDGVAAGEERITMLTTNHPDRLDAALVRPGRVDYEAELGYAVPEVVEAMWDRFYSEGATKDIGLSVAEVQRLKIGFLSKLRAGGLFDPGAPGVSTAELQGVFLFFKDNPKGAVQATESLLMGRSRGSIYK